MRFCLHGESLHIASEPPASQGSAFPSEPTEMEAGDVDRLLRAVVRARCDPLGEGERLAWRITWETDPDSAEDRALRLPVALVEPTGGTGTLRISPALDGTVLEGILRRWVLPALLELRGWTVLHGACIRFERGDVVLAGTSGAGKSTLAAELVLRGATLMADEFVGVRLVETGAVTGAPDPVVRLRPDAWRRLAPALGEVAWRVLPGGKREARLHFGSRRPEVLPAGDGERRLSAVVVLRRDIAPGCRRLEPREGLGRLLELRCGPGIFERGALSERFRRTAELARRIPILELGRSADPASDARRLSEEVAPFTGRWSAAAVRRAGPPLPEPLDTPENRLLLAAARVAPDPEADARIRRELRVGAPEWSVLLQAADAHGVLPLAARSLLRAAPERVPGALRERLWRSARRIAATNLRLEQELNGVVRLLREHGIDAAAFKGPALARSLYGGIGLRQFSDVDVLVREEQAVQATLVMTAAGFEPSHRFSGRQLRALVRNGSALVFRGRAGIPIDVQWRIAPPGWPLTLGFDDVVSGSESATVDEAPAARPRLRPEPLLLALCTHGAKHGWRRLVWLTDVAELLRSQPHLDRGAIEARLERAGARSILDLPLALAGRLLDCPAVDTTAPKLEKLILETQERLLAPSRLPPGPTRLLGFQVRLHERPHDRLRIAARLAVHTGPGDWRVVPLPDALFPFYGFIRPMRLGIKYGLGGVLRAARRVARRPPAPGSPGRSTNDGSQRSKETSRFHRGRGASSPP